MMLTDESAETRSSRRDALKAVGVLAALVGTLGLLFGLAFGHWRSSPGPFMRPLAMSGRWITAPGDPGYAGYFRRRIDIAGPVKHAWVIVAPREGFEVCVNQNPCARFYLWRPTRPFQTGLSEPGQLINASPATLALNFPREYQWSSHRNDWLPTIVDITPHLRPGKNVISVEVESRKAPAMFRLDGEIELWSGERIRFDSDDRWLGEPVPPFDVRHDWTERDYNDHAWRNAVDLSRSLGVDALPDFHFQSFDHDVLTTPLSADWLRHPTARSDDCVWFEGTWDLPHEADDAWIRFATNRHFDLFVNDRRVSVPLLGNPDLDSGDWVLGTQRGSDLPASPELLDPDEVGSLFVGDRFESPRHGDPSAIAFKRKENTLNVTRDKERATTRSDLPGTYDPIKPEDQDVMPHDAVPYLPEVLDPKALGRDRAVGTLVAYNIRSMLHEGRNTIAVRTLAPLTPDRLNWAPQLALDGEAWFRDGSRVRIETGKWHPWTCRLQGPTGDLGPDVPALIEGAARVPAKGWPATSYRGIAHSPSQIFREKLGWILGSIGGFALLSTAIVGSRYRLLRRANLDPWAAVAQASREAGRCLLPPISILLAALLTEASWSERHEAILFRLPRVWPAIFLVTSLSPLLLAVPCVRLFATLSDLPRTRYWTPILAVVLVACAVLRIYKLDFQPLDDDEYASCQAIVSIANTGAPGFVPKGVFYTRSPAYHYLIGAIVYVFGENLWAMRLPCAAFGVATAVLMYWIASRMLRRPWTGLAALILFTLHPFAIYSAHLVRFYQQQQFFSLLAFVCFCKGFLGKPSQKYRYWTVIAFFLAVISQEITAIMAFQLAVGVFFLGREAGWKANIRLLIVGAIAIGFIVLDLLVFQALCLTRTEGVSPNVEASIKPHFWDPYNLISIFLGYSRLHVPPSLIFMLAMPLLVRRGGRVVWAMLFFLFSGVILTNLLVSHVSLRYQYWMITLWLLLACRGLGLLAERLTSRTHVGPPNPPESRGVAALLATPIFLAFLLAWSPWRIVDSYECKILNDSTGAFRYVRGQLRHGDAIAANEPHPHAAHLEAGHVNYDLTVPLLQDFVMLVDGRLIDRNGGGEVISSLDELLAACKKHERLWIVVNREKFRTRGKNLRWEYPAARIELFLRKNCEIKHRTYLWTVFLWDKSRGQFRQFRE